MAHHSPTPTPTPPRAASAHTLMHAPRRQWSDGARGRCAPGLSMLRTVVAAGALVAACARADGAPTPPPPPPPSAGNCTMAAGHTIGSTKAFAHFDRVTPAECCSKCWATTECAGFNLEPALSGRGIYSCFLQSDTRYHLMKPGSMSSVARGGSGPPGEPATVTLSKGVVWRTSPLFKSWNIDASPNRGWDARNLSDPKLHYLARASMPGYLRFGGGGNDGLPYLNCSARAVASAPLGSPRRSTLGRCLNASWFGNLMELAHDAGAHLVFGLSMSLRDASTGRWDPSQARQLIKLGISSGYTFAGFELGNEQNYGRSPASEAADFKVLHGLLVELFPDASTRPGIMGPDPHGIHNPEGTQGVATFLSEFVGNVTALGVPMSAITHHEYIEIGQYSTAPPPGDQLDFTGVIAAGINATLAPLLAPGVGIWAGEIGPHNGGSPPCDASRSLRWANFADSFWYMDAMASTALHGYSAFCRQDFVGIDYGLVDCLTYDPLPDYWSGLLWSRLMGAAVLRAHSTANETVRAYVHCAANSTADATLLLLNLDAAPAPSRNVTLSVGGAPFEGAWVEYHLTGPQGTNASVVALNGEVIRLTAQGEVPPLSGRPVAAGGPPVVSLAAASIAFVVLEGAGESLGCGSG